MGGYGSGQRGTKKAVVEGRLTLDTADLKRWNLLAPGLTHRTGTLRWYRNEEPEPTSSLGYTLNADGQMGTLCLSYQWSHSAEAISYPIRLVTTRCHLGGVRWWFLCTLLRNGGVCCQHVRKLYLRGQYFGCRYCHNLTYTSTQESDSRVYAILRSGLALDMLDGPQRMSTAQLGLALKALTVEQMRLDRHDKRHARTRGGQRRDVHKS